MVASKKNEFAPSLKKGKYKKKRNKKRKKEGARRKEQEERRTKDGVGTCSTKNGSAGSAVVAAVFVTAL